MDTAWQEAQRLFIAYRTGDAAACVTFYRTLDRLIGPFLRTRLRNEQDAQETRQKLYLKIHLARDAFDTTLSLKSWIFAIASRLLIDHWRKAGLEPSEAKDPSDDGTAVSAIPSPSHAEQVLARADLEKMLLRLKPIDRMIVLLFEVEELTAREVSECVGLSENAVKLRVSRSYQKMRRFFLQQGTVS